MTEVVILNGPPSVGKSTVCDILRGLAPGTVAIAGDALRAFAPPDARAHLGGGATYRVAGALTREFLGLGATRVICDYVFLRAAHFAYFRSALPASAQLTVFTLWAPLEILAAREGKRAKDRGLGPALADCLREMTQNRAQMGEIIECGEASPEQLAQRIHARLHAPGDSAPSA